VDHRTTDAGADGDDDCVVARGHRCDLADGDGVCVVEYPNEHVRAGYRHDGAADIGSRPTGDRAGGRPDRAVGIDNTSSAHPDGGNGIAAASCDVQGFGEDVEHRRQYGGWTRRRRRWSGARLDLRAVFADDNSPDGGPADVDADCRAVPAFVLVHGRCSGAAMSDAVIAAGSVMAVPTTTA
jgi:hypothetical protein